MLYNILLLSLRYADILKKENFQRVSNNNKS